MSHREESLIKMERLGRHKLRAVGGKIRMSVLDLFLEQFDKTGIISSLTVLLNTAVKPSGTGAFWKGDDNSISVSLRVMILRP